MPAAFLLTGCDSVKDALGMNHYQPDEFLVATNPPLELPPSYHVRPPRAGEAPLAQSSPATQAQKAMGVSNKDKTDAPSPTVEGDLIQKARRDIAVNPQIRDTLDKEAQTTQN
jgi:hypothetical protein